MKKLLVGLLLIAGTAYAETTPNLVNNNNWSGVGAYAPDPNNCCSNPAGSQPLYDTNTNTIKFSYGQATVQQGWAINQVLQGSGIQVGGYNYSYDLRNMNGRGGQNGTDSLTVNTWLKNSAGQIILNTNNIYNTQFDWTSHSGTMSLTSPMATTDLGSGGVSFSGKDGGYWGGLYGPEVRNVNYSLNYTVDPCSVNPRHSPSCSGYNDVWMSGDLTSTYGTAFAVNQALGFGNSGVQVHSAIIGFDYTIDGQYCSSSILGFCTSWNNSSVRGVWNVSDQNNNVIASDDRTIDGHWTSGTYRNEILIGRDISTIGNTNLSLSTTGNASTTNPHIEFTFRPDICQSDPLVNPSCPGYAEANFTLQCTINSLYDVGCPGYAVAFYNLQCSLDALYDTGCPGYALAYYNYQCSLDALYHTGCPGYEQAYYNQQCTINALYDVGCPGYEQAYYNQQCTLDALYDAGCPGYKEAYATKLLLEKQNNQTTAEVTTTAPAEVSATGDATVDKVIKTETASATSATAVVQLAPPPTQQSVTQTAQTEETTQDDMVSEKPQQENSTSDTQTASNESNGSSGTGSEKTKRKELAAKRAEARKEAALKAGKEATENMDSAKSMEAQVALQNVVIGAMAFVPGFNAYDFIMPDGLGYKPFQIYKKQANVDNARLVRGLSGASEKLHTDLVNLQYVRN